MTKKVIAFIVFLGLILTFGAPKASLAIDCSSSIQIVTQSDKDYCQNELNKIEEELAILLKRQQAQQKQTGTLKGDVDYLTSQINALKTKIKSRSVAIAQIQNSIKEKNSKIVSLSQKIAKEHESLAQLLRNTNEFDNENIFHLILSDKTISEYYSDLESYASIKQAVKDSVDEINGIKKDTEIEKKDLEVKQDKETDAKAELESAQKKVAQSEAEKKELLAISKQKEEAYKKLAEEKRLKANRIRSALFKLAGTSEKIDFGTALAYANEAKQKFGIDPAFLLAILTQESNLGANVGKCYLTSTEGPQAGYGVNITTGKVWPNLMKPTRDITPFLNITGRLGIDPFKTMVSCPIAGVQGYGGAMGPAQFIPSTWKIFEGRLKNLLGHDANPWEPRDAFMASAMYLTDLGAIGTSASAQSKAACKYYGSGGATCTYSKSVAALKLKIQADIDYLVQYGNGGSR